MTPRDERRRCELARRKHHRSLAMLAEIMDSSVYLVQRYLKGIKAIPDPQWIRLKNLPVIEPQKLTAEGLRESAKQATAAVSVIGSQAKLAQHLGTSTSYVSLICKGKRGPAVSHQRRIQVLAGRHHPPERGLGTTKKHQRRLSKTDSRPAWQRRQTETYGWLSLEGEHPNIDHMRPWWLCPPGACGTCGVDCTCRDSNMMSVPQPEEPSADAAGSGSSKIP